MTTCSDCKFSTPQLDKKGTPLPDGAPLLCRRFPPTPHPVFGAQLSPQHPPMQFGSVSVVSVVQPNAWCGEFDKRPPRILS